MVLKYEILFLFCFVLFCFVLFCLQEFGHSEYFIYVSRRLDIKLISDYMYTQSILNASKLSTIMFQIM